MATFIDLYSGSRDSNTFPSPANYIVRDESIRSWTRIRTVSNAPKNPINKPTSFLFSVNLKSMVLPYNLVGGTVLSDVPRIYVNIATEGYHQSNLIDTIGQKQSDSKFICEISSIQTDSFGNPKWIRYHSLFEQVMLFDIRKPLIVRMFLPDGTDIVIPDAVFPVPPIADNQTFITLEVTPYIRDGDYANHVVDFA